MAKLGEPYGKQVFHFNRRREEHEQANFRYSDGENDYVYTFRDDELQGIRTNELRTIPKDSLIFATVFQFFFLRLAIFFGCVGIFTNLFRGELLDKSLHFYLLAPIRREVLLVGKYLAGLIATVVIFTTSTALQLLAIGWHLTGPAMTEYLHGPGMRQIGAYLGVTALACLGYGSVFLAAGLLFKQSHYSGGGSAVVGERESVSAGDAEEDQRDFLFAIDVSGGGETERHASAGGAVVIVGRGDAGGVGGRRAGGGDNGGAGAGGSAGEEAGD